MAAELQRPQMNRRRFAAVTVAAALVALSLVSGAHAAQDGLARTPPMGYNTWNAYECDIHEDKIRETADLMVSRGLLAAGYDTLTIDDCWAIARNETTKQIIVDPALFPSGMKALSDYVRSKGLKFGIYSNAGLQTCMKRPGSLYYEDIDVQTYDSWNVDYLKYDTCNTGGARYPDRYIWMWNALKNKTNTQRDIIYSINARWGRDKPWLLAGNWSHLWRTTPDIIEVFNGKTSNSRRSVIAILDEMDGITQYSSPGGWNDLDMLEVGNGMTLNQDTAHFLIWAALKSPLLIGAHIANLTEDHIRLLTDRDVIAINQDPLGVSARRVQRNGEADVWAGPLSGGSAVAVLINRGKTPLDVRFDFTSLSELSATASSQFSIRDVYLKNDLGPSTGFYSVSLPGESAQLIKITGVNGGAATRPSAAGRMTSTSVSMIAGAAVAAGAVLAAL